MASRSSSVAPDSFISARVWRSKLDFSSDGLFRSKLGAGRHREDGSGIAVHYDTAGAVYYLVLGNAQLQVLFKVVLEHLVQREHQAVAVHG